MSTTNLDIRVFDLETTGVDPKEHQIIEIAAVDIRAGGEIVCLGSRLINPGRFIPPEASAIHHLTDIDVADASTFTMVWPDFSHDAPAIYAAHYCEFEQGYIPTPEGTDWICTYKVALRAWPDAPGHSNQVLRYWRGLDKRTGFDRALASLSHRAEPDAYVTAWLLLDLLATVNVNYMIAWTKEPKVYPFLNFGKYRGQKWSEVPLDYVRWLRDGQHQMDADWRYGAKLELQRREMGL